MSVPSKANCSPDRNFFRRDRSTTLEKKSFALRHDISPEKGDNWKQIETFCRYPVGTQSHPIKPGKHSEASLACSRGDSLA